MSTKGAKKLGFFAALTMMVGSVVGIGIFFKSHGILRSNDWNGTGTFLAWLLGGLLSLAAAISFSEISSLKTKKVHGLSAWAEATGGNKFGYFVRFNFSFFYYGLLSAVLAVFGSEMIFSIITSMKGNGAAVTDYPVYAHIILGLGLAVFFYGVNYLSVKASGMIASVSTILKWIPLILVALLGILFATTNNWSPEDRLADAISKLKPGEKPPVLADFQAPKFGQNAFTNGESFNFVHMLAALPAVLFAFDAFLGIGSMRNKMEEPKRLPMVVLIGMISVLVLYLLIALAAIFHGSGLVSGAPMGAPAFVGAGIFDQILDPSQAIIMGKFIVVFITISTFGVMNGISAVALSTHEQAVATNSVFGLKTLKAKIGEKKTIIIYTLITLVFWTAVFGIPAIVLNSDSIVDGLSNFPTLFFFAIYGIVILLYTLKRGSFGTTKMNNILFKTFAWIAIIGIVFVVGYQVVYGFFINAILNPTETTHWGLYAGDAGTAGKAFPSKSDVSVGVGMTLAQSAIIMFTMIAVFFALPLLNIVLTKKFENNIVLEATFEKTLAKK